MEFAEPTPRLNLPSSVQLFQPCFWILLIWKCQEITFLPSTSLLQVSAVKQSPVQMPSLLSQPWRQHSAAGCVPLLPGATWSSSTSSMRMKEVLMLSQTYGETWKWLSQLHLFSLVFRKGKRMVKKRFVYWRVWILGFLVASLAKSSSLKQWNKVTQPFTLSG